MTDNEFAAFIAESRRLTATHPELAVLPRCFAALDNVRARQRVAAVAV